MDFIKQVEIGLSTFIKGVEFIFRNKLGWFFVFPFLINIILLVLGFSLAGDLSQNLQDLLLEEIQDESGGFWGSKFFQWTLAVIIWLVFKIMFFLVFAYVGGYIVLMLMAPVLAYLSEKTEEIITGIHYEFSIEQFVRDVFRGIMIAGRNLFIEVGYIILLGLISIIPVIGFVSPFALFFVSSYFYGFSFMDYTNERKKRSIKESLGMVRKYRGVAIANGAAFSLLMLIPLIGPSLAGFSAIIAVVGATIAMHEIDPTK